MFLLSYTVEDGSLKYFYLPDPDPYDLPNIQAILKAYRLKQLEVNDEMTTVWFAGVMTMGHLKNSELDLEEVVEKVPEWEEKYGLGHI